MGASCTVAGASVDLITSELDPGAILARTEVAVLPDDTAVTLALALALALAIRVLLREHVIYPRAIAGLLAQLHLQHYETGLNPN